jgi:hypothetical protein
MNPWGEVPKTKKYPLGELQRILGESSSYSSYLKFAPKSTPEPEPQEDGESDAQIDPITLAESLLETNYGINELNAHFENLKSYTKYNDLVSEDALLAKAKILQNLLNVLNKGLLLNVDSSASKVGEGETFVTIEYQNRKTLIDLLKFIKTHESQIDRNIPLGIRDAQQLKDLVTYFYSKTDKTDVLFQKLNDVQLKLKNQHKLIEGLGKEQK